MMVIIALIATSILLFMVGCIAISGDMSEQEEKSAIDAATQADNPC